MPKLSLPGRAVALIAVFMFAASAFAGADASVGRRTFTAAGRPADGSFFPLAVWLQAPRNARRYADIGVNTYVALWRGPTEEQLDELDKAGIRLVSLQNERGLKLRDRKTIVGWMHEDEPDNAQSLGRGKGYGPPVKPEKIIEDYKRMKAADPDRPVLLNLGQGVAWDGWYGRGVRTNHPEDYPLYVRGCDIVSFDIYPVVHTHKDVAGKLEYVGRGVQRLVEWTGGKKPVWCCIETTHIDNPDKMPTPRQVRSEVWMAIVNGANGILYFCHEFKPRQIEAGLLEHPEIVGAVKKINAEVRELAPVINSPTVKDGATVDSSEKQVPVTLMCKRHGDATYVFAVSMREKATDATFVVAEAAETAKVEVVGEGRTIEGRGGKFSDRFEGYGVHLYRVK